MSRSPSGLTMQSLDDHRALNAGLLQDLRRVVHWSRALGQDEVLARSSEVLTRVENDVFRIAVVGEFKRGKSTLINALLGREVLPADILPCSATLNRVTYGLHPAVKLRFRPDESGARREETISIDALADYVTKLTPDSEQRAAAIEEAVVYYPVKYCRDKADIIDTPGLNDDAAMTDVTLQVLPKVDAAILVILAQSPFSSYEADFLSNLLTHDLGRVLFVVNRMDEIRRPRDRERVLQAVRDRIRRTLESRAADLHGEGTAAYRQFLDRVGTPKVFGVSGGLALDARLEDDAGLLEESGMLEFEQALERFLSLERGLVTLAVMADSILNGSHKVQQQIAIRRGALEMAEEEFEASYARTKAELAEMRSKLAAELSHLEQSRGALQEALHPRAAQVPGQLVEAARSTIRAFPLQPAEVTGKAREKTLERMQKAVTDRLQAVARTEAERTQDAISQAVTDEMGRLLDLSAEVARQLSGIELRFRAGATTDTLDDTMTAGVGGLAGAAVGGIWGGAIGGAVSGYRVAGLRGAATGAAAGAATSFATAFAGLFGASMLGLPLTWPVVLPALAIGGIAATFGARWATTFFFGDEQVERFKETVEEGVIHQLEASAHARVRDLQKATDQQVDATFDALRKRVQQDLGGAIDQTARTLEMLRKERAGNGAQRAVDLAELTDADQELSTIVARVSEMAPSFRPAH